jgi:hypothetical protein
MVAYRKEDSKAFQSLLGKHGMMGLCYPIVDLLYNFESNGLSYRGKCIVRVEAIKFNHDSLPHTNNALNIRKNYAEEISVPEWIKKYTHHEQSPAAYSISDVGKNRLQSWRDSL